SVEIGRDRWLRQKDEAHSEADEQNYHEPAPADCCIAFPHDEPRRQGIRQGLHKHEITDAGIIEMVDHTAAAERQAKQRTSEQQEPPIDADEPFHGAARVKVCSGLSRSAKPERCISVSIRARACRGSLEAISRENLRRLNSS